MATLSRPESAALKRADGAPCPYCQRTMDVRISGLMPTRDHDHPRSKGGQKTTVCCWSCNHIKADKTMEQWRAFMRAHPRWHVSMPPKDFRPPHNGPNILPMADTVFILTHGKRAWREMKAAQEAGA